MTIVIATGNRHKAEEFSRIFSDHRIVLPADRGIMFDPEETATTFYGNALIKARTLFELMGEPVIADDSGICVDALNGEPGVYSARYGATNGIELSAEDRNKLLLSRMKGIPDRTARFVCNMVLYYGPDRFVSVQETLEGSIVSESGSGSGGFGYDPVLYLPEYGKTVAELSDDQKDLVSHRGKAARKLQIFLNSEK
ncbi:MAG TPA: RdgB/HAM1 family non-canonical purine NTP pyrophosphatase [Treponemataceae bacterium]|jgi:XTP/dITP diphosphohydrolase|nr:RdgB/HAM1 family non-canonical purine NTP pyrophosphatase [Treponema sp.]OQB04121.1 MAG: Non-canonical purine NTP pyrophosphatase [Spirochaetes bacterium ADurb.Bin215]HPA11118.1 RdgB/HAM1 family non-canonical purine NTP pyrophosphatase [Treponemataceae bacterium]